MKGIKIKKDKQKVKPKKQLYIT